MIPFASINDDAVKALGLARGEISSRALTADDGHVPVDRLPGRIVEVVFELDLVAVTRQGRPGNRRWQSVREQAVERRWVVVSSQAQREDVAKLNKISKQQVRCPAFEKQGLAVAAEKGVDGPTVGRRASELAGVRNRGGLSSYTSVGGIGRSFNKFALCDSVDSLH